MNKYVYFPLIIGSIAISLFIFVSSTITSVLVFIPGTILSFIVYLKTFYRKTPDPEKILPLYLFALGIQFIHFTEEYLTNFPEVVPALFGQKAYPMDDWIVFNMLAYFVFILGGIVLFKRLREYMIIPLFFMLIGVALNSIGHICIALYVGGYFSGLYTSLIYLLITPVLLKRIFEQTPEIVKL